MDELFDLPRRAIAAFERATGLSLSIHDREKTLWFFLPAERFKHDSPFCCAVKASGREQACIQFDALKVHQQLAESGRARVQMCHAGVVECVAPVFHNKRLEWVLFAGPRTRGPDLRTLHAEPLSRALNGSKIALLPPMPPPVNEEDAQCYLELLTQLAVRLQLWRVEIEPLLKLKTRPSPVRLCSGFSRRAFILKFIYDHHRENVSLLDLAEHLHLSESRAGHAVREECGATFISLLTDARLKSAAGLLRYTQLPINDVAAQSGFGDLSHFHAVFRRRFKTSPQRYRRQAEHEKNSSPA